MKAHIKMQIPHFAFLLLFASEFTFYLLILQTGVVEYHHSIISEIWMVPVGGVLGIMTSILLHEERQWLIPFLLFAQLILVLDYAHADGMELFLLGLISGLTAPMLIARIDRLWLVVLALVLSYAYGTYYFDVPASDRTNIALLLSAVAFAASLFSKMKKLSIKTNYITFYSAGNIFFWLLLDAVLFETLSRDSVMHIWGNDTFTWNIILFHMIGLSCAYLARDWKHNSSMLLALFALTFTLYSLGWQWALSIVYPFVISYYNVIILKSLMRLPYVLLAVMALSLWAASGLGLLVALSGSFAIAWAILSLLGAMHIGEKVQIPFIQTLENLFSQIQNSQFKNL
jgi:beta-carotene 15,15'-dioxygenase